MEAVLFWKQKGGTNAEGNEGVGCGEQVSPWDGVVMGIKLWGWEWGQNILPLVKGQGH